MPSTAETFDLNATLALVGNAFGTVVCTIGFQLAVTGFSLALIIAVMGLIAQKQGKPTARPLLTVFKKLSFACAVIGLPGIVVLALRGHLPPVNALQLHPIGLLGFWALVIAHLCMEELNFQWFPEK